MHAFANQGERMISGSIVALVTPMDASDGIDWGALELPLPEFVHDLPGGAGRWIQRADGYVATVVNGAVALENGEHTGELAGQVLRSGPDLR